MASNSKLSIEDYLHKYVGPLSAAWNISRVSDGYSVTFPNKGSRLINEETIQWTEPFAQDHVTSTLWLHSLTYAPYFLIEHDDWETTANVFGGYASYLRHARSQSRYRPINSQDHAHAAQLLAACATMAFVLTHHRTEERVSVLVDFVEAVTESALSEGMILHNNHGVMLSRALTHVAFVFDGFTKAAEVSGSRSAAEFDSIVREAFDSDAVVNENTPAYQILWLKLIDSMADFTEQIGDPFGSVARWRELSERGLKSLALQLMPGGRVPPIGDDAGGTSPYPSLDGEFISTGNGLYVSKHDSSYISIISGYRGVVHKHVDDTSIRLHVNGQDLLIDAGLLNYDVNDPIGVSVVSQRGHSGLYFPQFDNLRSLDVFAARPPRQRSSLVVSTGADGSKRCECEYVIDDSYRARRRYTIHGYHCILIEDDFEGPPGTEAVQRFLIPKEARIRIRGPVLTAEFDQVEMQLRVDESSFIAIHNGDTSALPKGWRAARHYEPDRCWCVEIAPAPSLHNMRASLTVLVPGQTARADIVERFWRL